MQEVITMQDLILPEFDKNRRINQQKVLMVENDNVKYNIILGINFLSNIGIELNYSEGKMEWFDYSILLCPPGGLDLNKLDAMEDMFHIRVEDKLFGENWLKCFATEILDAKYERSDVVEVEKRLTHLNAHQKVDLLLVLQENDKMFDELLGVYLYKQGLTKCTSPETILKQIVYFFHVFCLYSVLLSTDLMYSRVPVDQGGPIFFRLETSFLAGVLRTNWYATICILDTNSYPNVSKSTYKIVCNKLVHINLYYFITN
jgi:hypothetical protein